MKEAVGVILFVLIFTQHAQGTRYSLPGKPTLTRCRSPEKETFTCWWEPGSDGGLPTTHALYYRKENSDKVYECPNYRAAGENSCFFNKNDTSIWVNYNITVVATNALGSTFSDPVDIDVVYIVKPNPPERLTVAVMEDKSWPFLRASWEPPHKADTRSGWITLIYEIRVKLEEEHEWEVHLAGQQKMFNIFSLRSGGTYLVQVRCKPDHGFWSEWSSPSRIKVPEYFHPEKSVWVLVTVFSVLIFLILTWLLHMNSHSLKHCILPPVPGPKIKGLDKQLLKNGKSDEVFSALVVSDFPPTASTYEDLLVEYLEVYVPKEQEQLERKDVHDGYLKSEGSTSDSDSGRGSCDSHTLLMDKCAEAKEKERQTDQERMGPEAQRYQKDWQEDALARSPEDLVSPDMSSGRVKTWPSVFSPLMQYSSGPLEQQSSLETAKQQYLSDSMLPPSSTPSYLTQPSHSTKEALGPSYWEFCSSGRHSHLLHPQMQACQQLQAHSDSNISSNISSIGREQAPAGLVALQSTENADVQRVTGEDTALLRPVQSGSGRGEGCPQVPQGEDYSKVKGVDKDNMLLLQGEKVEDNVRSCAHQETNRVKENCCTSSTVSSTKNPPHSAMAVQGKMAVAPNGYVDTASICTLPTF